MSFLHLSLLAGLAVITVPIMLHMFGQKQPQLIDFPALRFVRETRQEQSSSWQLRHILLLLLRILLLAALALALARPRVHSAMLGSVLGITTMTVLAGLASLIAAVAFVSKRPASIWLTCVAIAASLWAAAGLWGVQSLSAGPRVPSSDSSAPIATVIIVDNGPTMSYKSGNQLRLDVAKEMATWILEQLPTDSRVGVLGGAPVAGLALDPSTAMTQVKILEPSGAHVDLLLRIRTAIDLVLANELERKEVYVVTDLMSASWNAAQADLVALLEEHKDEVLVQVIDVGEIAVSNFQLGDVESDFNTVPAGGDVTFQVQVHRLDRSSNGKKNPTSIELLQEAIDPRLPVIANNKLQVAPTKVVDRQVVDLEANASSTLQLTARELEPGTHHFTLRLDQPDPLMIDNERFVTIIAREQQPTLIVADDPDLALQLRLTVDPSDVRGPQGDALVDDVRFAQLPQVQLEKYEVICLLDPPPLSSKVTQSLKEHVLGGGGLLTILGPALGTVQQAGGNAVAELLPGKLAPLRTRERTDRSLFLVPVALTHPLFHELLATADTAPWHTFPVFRHWTFESLAENAMVLMTLSDGESPAVVSHQLGRGQVLTLTTPIPEAEMRGRDLWNELWVGGDPWPAYGLLLGAFRTLSGADQTNLNFAAGEPVSVSNDSFAWPSRYELFTPAIQTRRVDASQGLLSLGRFEQPGIYRLRGQLQTPVSRGFSVNVPAEDTQLQRIEIAELDQRLGEGNYRVARSRDEVESSIGQARFGRELYPLLMVFVAGLFLAEQAMSNRFYKLKFTRSRGSVAR